MSRNKIDDDTVIALTKAGVSVQDALRLTGVLRDKKLLRSELDVKAVSVREEIGKRPYVSIERGDGRKFQGYLDTTIEVRPWGAYPYAGIAVSSPFRL